MRSRERVIALVVTIGSSLAFTAEDRPLAKGEGLMAYDIESNAWSHLKPRGTGPAPANTNAAFYE